MSMTGQVEDWRLGGAEEKQTPLGADPVDVEGGEGSQGSGAHLGSTGDGSGGQGEPLPS